MNGLPDRVAEAIFGVLEVARRERLTDINVVAHAAALNVLAVAADVNEIAMALHGPFCAFPQDCSGAGYGDYLRAEAVAAHLLDRS